MTRVKGAPFEPVPEKPVRHIPAEPDARRVEAVRELCCWPDGVRPDDYLDPGEFAAELIGQKVAALPPPPASAAAWRALRKKMLAGVRRSVRTPFELFESEVVALQRSVVRGREVTRMVVEPELGIRVPVLVLQETMERQTTPSRLAVVLTPNGLADAANSPQVAAMVRRGWAVAMSDLRGIGETRPVFESSGYYGFRDADVCMAALKQGHTLAGLWTRDLLAVIAALRSQGGYAQVPIAVWAERETGIAAILAAATTKEIDRLVLDGFWASYVSKSGYGKPYVYRDENNRPPAKQDTASYGSGVLWLPDILDYADVPQLLALVAPTPLLFLAPIALSGEDDGGATPYDWTRRVYEVEAPSAFTKLDRRDDKAVVNWIDGDSP